jgi:hypothetical protein
MGARAGTGGRRGVTYSNLFHLFGLHRREVSLSTAREFDNANAKDPPG